MKWTFGNMGWISIQKHQMDILYWIWDQYLPTNMEWKLCTISWRNLINWKLMDFQLKEIRQSKVLFYFQMKAIPHHPYPPNNFPCTDPQTTFHALFMITRGSAKPRRGPMTQEVAPIGHESQLCALRTLFVQWFSPGRWPTLPPRLRRFPHLCTERQQRFQKRATRTKLECSWTQLKVTETQLIEEHLSKDRTVFH